ncbi:AtzE family amidohydrolase [Hyphomicrobium sp.]|uniref:AtzE family amidohydrolase n=1 Tax=Hyphomicrobium sp. TaxID=82 RepID=UPI0025BF11B0|nr:AtzE family amidohydrolase [Hyphomicrobium sp.]MCC7251752.1 AtzE family amidohydrolase [Hyphomicrobium sp.]
MTAPPPATARNIARTVSRGDASAEEILRAALARIDARDGEIGAFTDITRERALSEAKAVDGARTAGRPLGPLAGVPYAVKNLYAIAGLSTRAGSKISAADPPAEHDALLIARLRAAGAVLLGALNMGEYAYDFTGENAHYGPSRNPLDTARMTGGSSGGSAAAVAAGFVPVALGSDTNGSIRVPAAFCGLYGLKPTYGRLPRTGTFPFCDSLDHLGPFARSVADLALVYDVLQGHDASDPVCARRAAEPIAAEISKGSDGLRIAVATGYFRADAEPGALAALDRAAAVLGVSDEVDIPRAAEARAAAFLITNAEGSALHLERLRRRPADFDPDTRDRFIAGALLPASWYVAAQRFRRVFEGVMAELFQRFDVILAPATPTSAPLLGQKTLSIDGKDVPLRAHMGIYTQPISFVGLPVAAVPVREAGALPHGIQVIAAPWREDVCLRVAAALEAAGLNAIDPATGA